MKKPFHYLFTTHHIITIGAMFLICALVAMHWFNESVEQFPEGKDFALTGHVALTAGPSVDMYLLTYVGNERKRTKITTSSFSAAVTENLGQFVILPDPGLIYVSLWTNNDNTTTYTIHKLSNGVDTSLGTYDEQTMEQRMRDYGKVDISMATDTIRVEHYNYILFGTRDLCGEGGGGYMNFVPTIYLCFSYNDNGLYVGAVPSPKKVYTFSEITFPMWKRYIKVTGLSYDKKLAIVEFGYYTRHGEDGVRRTYAYDIKNNKWALLTDNLDERVIALR